MLEQDSNLSLYRWTGSDWVSLPSIINVIDNTLSAYITADGTYAMLGESGFKVYLPITKR